MHNQRHPHPPHPHQPPSGMPRPREENTMSSSITERDRKLLMELLDNSQEAENMFAMLQNSPPEVANIGYLVLRVFEKLKSS